MENAVNHRGYKGIYTENHGEKSLCDLCSCFCSVISAVKIGSRNFIK